MSEPKGHNPAGRVWHWAYCVKCGLPDLGSPRRRQPGDLLAQARLKIGELTERVDVLEAALDPFAEYARRNDDNQASAPIGDGCPLSLNLQGDQDRAVATLGDCRYARKVLQQQPEGESE